MSGPIANACSTIGQYGASACTKFGSVAGSALEWTANVLSQLADKVAHFITNVAWPAVKQFGEWLAKLASSLVEVAKKHPKEMGAAVTGAAAAGAGTVAGLWCCKNAASNNTQAPAPKINNPAPINNSK